MNGDPIYSPLATTVLVSVLVSVGGTLLGLAVFAPRSLAIVRRDLAAFFSSPVAYVTFIFYALMGGNSFNESLLDMMRQDEPSLAQAFLGSLTATLLVAPVLTMRMLAEERERGTLELLLTTVTRPWEVAVGKYLSAMCLYGLLVALTGFYYVGVVRCLGADIDHGQVLAGYLGMLLFGSGLVSIGLMVSAFSRNAMSAVVVTLGIFFGLLFLQSGIPRLQQLVTTVVATVVPGAQASGLLDRVAEATGDGLRFLSMIEHIGRFLDGRIDMRDVAYHVSVTAFCLIMVHIALVVKRN